MVGVWWKSHTIHKATQQGKLDNVTIDNDDKFIHYLRELYHSSTFTDKTVINRSNKPTANQTYGNTIIFFENKNME